MNIHIQKLAEQALDSAIQHTWSMLDYDEIAKLQEHFAKLIIQECIDIISPYAIKMEDYAGGHPVWEIKKRFGV